MTKDTTSNIKTLQFEGIVDYARVHTPYTTNNKSGEYSLSLRLDTQEQVTKFKKLMKDNNVSEMVLNPVTEEKQPRLKDNGDGTFSVNIKRDAIGYASGKAAIITVVDSQNNPIPKSILIGNGSRAVVEMFSYEGKKGGVLRLSGLQVLDLVPFTSNTNFKPRKTGFTVQSSGLDLDDTTDQEVVF